MTQAALREYVYVFRVGTKSGNASAPTPVLLSVRHTFPYQSRVHGAGGQSACVCGVGALNSQSCHANIRPVTSHFVYKPPDLDLTFVKPTSCRYAFTELAQTLAKPVHQLLSYCPSGKSSLVGSTSAEPKINLPALKKVTSSTARLSCPFHFTSGGPIYGYPPQATTKNF